MEVNAHVHKLVLGYKQLVSTLQETLCSPPPPPPLWVYVHIYLLFQNVYMVMQCAKEAVSLTINQSHKLKQYRHLRYKMRLQCPSVFATK